MAVEIKTESYGIRGMTCASCAANLESHLKSQKGILDASVNYPNQSLFIRFDPSAIDLKKIQTAADNIGYHVIEEKSRDMEDEYRDRIRDLRIKLIAAVAFTLPVFVLSMFFHNRFNFGNYIMFALTIPVILWSGAEFFVNAWKKIRYASANMDTLVALSTGSAFLFSVLSTFYPGFFTSRGLAPHVYFESAAVIITMILAGRYLEEKAKHKTTGAIKKLMGLQPKFATIIENGEQVVKPVIAVNKEEVMMIKPGEKISLDGIILKGNTYIDESMINGEPIPGAKSPGDYVFAGTINQNGSIEVRVEKEAGNTLLSQIIMMVKNAQASKPPVQKLADRISAIFVPVVIAISIVAFSIWYFAGPEPRFTYAFMILITVLIIACPCALGLATPTALMVGIGKGADLGILIKNADSLETAYKINALVVDKTGTITTGNPKVVDVHWIKPGQAGYLAPLLYTAELKSEHPLARAITEYFKGYKTENVSGITNIPGKGITFEHQGTRFNIGNEVPHNEPGINTNPAAEKYIEDAAGLGHSLVYFSDESSMLAILSIADVLRPGVKEIMKELGHMGIEVHMLTGDHEISAAKIAAEAGILKYKAGVLPSEKGLYIRNLRDKGRIVAMAGDGINDSQALATADIGIAMGSGTDIAMESAGITLINPDLGKIKTAIGLSKKTVTTIRQNLFWAFFYNLAAIPVAAGILFPINGFLLNPMIAGIAMALSSVSVVTNSLRLRNKEL